jgi:hypothetical protein
MIYNLDGFNSINYEALINDTLSLIPAIEKIDINKFN